MTTPSLTTPTTRLLLLLPLLGLLLLVLSTPSSSSSALETTEKPSARIQGGSVWELLRQHYGYENGGYLGFSLQLFIFQNREDLLRQHVERLRTNGRLSNLCRYVTREACSRPVQSQNSMFLYIAQTMNAQCCQTGPVNGNWGQWGVWSACSVTCGYGMRTRARACDSPAPSGGGQTCVGYGVGHQQCYRAACGGVPVNGAWGHWGSWSTCSVTCGLGSTSRSRQCDSPAPSGGGQQCPGNSVDQGQCFLTTCPSEATWGQWGQWSVCSVSCGQGMRTRTRPCDSPTGQQQCLGSGVAWEQCYGPSCQQRTCSVTQYPPSVRIFGGSAARPGQYPWLVHLVIDGTIRCAAVIVDTMHVLTAAHCLGRDVQNDFVTTQNLEIIAGNYKRSVTLEPNAQRISIAKGLRHREYDPIYLTNDVAILQLERALTFNNVVTNICLPSKTDTLPKSCVAAGWGALSFSDDFPDQLQHVELLVYDHQACVDTFNATTNYDIGQFLMDGVMCAANGTSGGMDSCRGDSGSGLMCLDRDGQGPYYKLFGLVSSGFGCGLKGQPGYYAYLPYYADWVKDAIRFLSF